ncbi:MAG: hypothetical protein ACRD22_03770 [Terriglobia bacterium]
MSTKMVAVTYDCLTLAKEQLDTALALFLGNKNYSSAITLAGAAEVIFGCALIARGRASALESSYGSIAEIHRTLYGTELNKKEFVSKENLARDALKHLQENKGSTIVIDLEEAACWMLVRAIHNGSKLGFEFERCHEFDNWFYENIVGL